MNLGDICVLPGRPFNKRYVHASDHPDGAGWDWRDSIIFHTKSTLNSLLFSENSCSVEFLIISIYQLAMTDDLFRLEKP